MSGELNNYSIESLNDVKNTIEKMEKYHQIEILRILAESKKTKLNENKSGVFINLTLMEQDVLEKIQNYINYVKEQTSLLNKIENEKEQYKNTFFNQSCAEEKDMFVSIQPPSGWEEAAAAVVAAAEN